MTARHIPEVLLARDEIVAPPYSPGCEDQTFELPPALHIATGALFLGFVGVLSFAFMSEVMAIVFGVCAAFIAAFFAVPAIFVRAAPDSSARAIRWSVFAEQGIDTATGRETAGSATVLVLLLPFLILCWAIAVAIIAALV